MASSKKAVIGKDGFVKVGKVKAGSKVSVQYPLRKMKMKEEFCGWKFTIEWRGDTVVSIDPPGKRAPFFNRKHLKYRQMPDGPDFPLLPGKRIRLVILR